MTTKRDEAERRVRNCFDRLAIALRSSAEPSPVLQRILEEVETEKAVATAAIRSIPTCGGCPG